MLSPICWSRTALGFTGHQHFFCGVRTGGKPLIQQPIRDSLVQLPNKAGIEKLVSPQVLRHSYATRLLHNGFTIREVQELLGHSDVSTTQIYSHVNAQGLREKIQGRMQAEELEAVADELARLPRARLVELLIEALAESEE